MVLTWPLQEVQGSLDANADWLENMDKAVEHLSSKCPASDVLDLRRDADAVHVLWVDVLSCLQQLVARTTETDAQASEVCCRTVSVFKPQFSQ